jgi:hypothetical protein
MEVREEGRVILVSRVQPRNAEFPIEEREAGRVILERLDSPWKAESPIDVTSLPAIVVGTVMLPDAFET